MTLGCGVVEREPFVRRHEAACRLGGAAEAVVHVGAAYQLSTWTIVSRSMRGAGLKSVPFVNATGKSAPWLIGVVRDAEHAGRILLEHEVQARP